MSRPADRRTKIELLRAAEAVFVEHGLTGAKVEDITGRAGVSKGAFYLHFESKDDAFRQIIEGFLAKLSACISAPDDAASMPTVAAQLARWRAHDVEVFDFCWQNRGLMRTVLAGGGDTTYAYLIDEFAERLAKQTAAWIRLATSAGIYRPEVDPEITAAMISGAYDRLVRDLIAMARRPDIEEWSRQAVNLFTRGLLTADARAILDPTVTESAPDEPPALSKTGTIPRVRRATSGQGKRARER